MPETKNNSSPAWTQLWVETPPGNGYTTPQAMQQVDEHIQAHGAVFCAPQGVPIQESDGTWEIRCYGSSDFVEFVLTRHYGLKITKKVVNGDNQSA
jgi:hypothetical protein